MLHFTFDSLDLVFVLEEPSIASLSCTTLILGFFSCSVIILLTSTGKYELGKMLLWLQVINL